MLILAPVIWGSAFVVMKNSVDSVPVFYLLAFRFAVAAVLLALIFHRKMKLIDRAYLKSGVILGTYEFLAYAVQTFGLEDTTPGKNAFLTAIYCVIVPFLYWAVAHRKPDRYNILSALLCIAGIGMVSLQGSLHIGLGDLLTLISGFFFACQMVAVARLSQGRDVFLLTTLQFAASAVQSLVCGLLFSQPPHALGSGVWASLLYLAVFSTAGALLFQNLGQKYTPPATAAVLLSLEAPLGVLFSIIFYHERPTPVMLAGFALIFVAILCSETKFEFLRKKVSSGSAEKIG
jgi:drug/metabolite transporter (DMT)-like permease